MNLKSNNQFYRRIESQIEFELKEYRRNESNNDFFSESRLEFLTDDVCNYCEEIKIEALLFGIKIYTKKVIILYKQLNIIHSTFEHIKPTFLFLLRKFWIIVVGLFKKVISFNLEYFHYFRKRFDIDDSTTVTQIAPTLLPFLISNKVALNVNLHTLSQFELPLIVEDELKSVNMILVNIQDKYFSRAPFTFTREKSKVKGNNRRSQKLVNEISSLSTLKERTNAILNIITFSNKRESEAISKLDFNGYTCLLNLWQEYIVFDCEEKLIIEIIETRKLPSMDLKCEILFSIIYSINQTDKFKKVLEYILSNTLNDHNLIHKIYLRWGNVLGKGNNGQCSTADINSNKLDHWKLMRLLAWKIYIIKTLETEAPFHIKLQSVVIFLNLLIEPVESGSIYKEEFECIKRCLDIFSDEILVRVPNGDICFANLERNILPNISVFSEKSIFSSNLIISVGRVLENKFSYEQMESIYYQLIANIMWDPFIKSNFYLNEKGNKLDKFAFNFSNPRELLVQGNLSKFIYLFGLIPIQVITNREGNFDDFGEVNLCFKYFCSRVSLNSTFYFNSTKFIMTFSKLIGSIRRDIRENSKYLILLLIELIKRFYQYLTDYNRQKTGDSQYSEDKSDGYYSYTVLYIFLNSCFEEYADKFDEHLNRALKSIKKPELMIPKNEILIY
ncbi:hypothetical protein HWI79_1086 [Cryptosporidium felis]|nr:hypothetical protein HWI79_1086 [Cryptosporidium felis]